MDDQLYFRLNEIIQKADNPARIRFLQYCLFFCLLLIEDPKTIIALEQRKTVNWWHSIHNALTVEKFNSPRNWSAYCLGKLLYISGVEISRTLLNEPWDYSREDITPAELRRIYSALFAAKLGEPRTFEASQQESINSTLKRSELFRDTSFPNTVEWYRKIRSNIQIFLPVWSEVIPANLVPKLGIQALSLMRAVISQAQGKCPSLHDHKASFLLILASYGTYPHTTNNALDEWATSEDGRNWYHSLMTTFWSTKEAAICVLTVAALLCVPSYRTMSSAYGAHQPVIDPFLDLGTFVEEQGPEKRKAVMEKAAFSAIRVLMDEDPQHGVQEPQQREYKYLSAVLTYALGKNPTVLGCLEGVLDHYWLARLIGPTDHATAYKISLDALARAGYLSQGASCSHMASFTTLRGSIREIEKVDFQSNLETEGGNKEESNTLDGRNVALDHAFNVLFLGRPGVGKSQIINKAVSGKFDDSYTPTFHDEQSKPIQVSDKVCRLDIVDIEGQDPYGTTTYPWFSSQWAEEKRDAFVLVYDTTSRSSFKDIPHLFGPPEHSRDAIIILIGTKIDREQQRLVQPKEGVELAMELGAFFWEVSAREGLGIEEMFHCLTLLLLERQESVETLKESVWEPDNPLERFWKGARHVISQCMGRA